MTLTVGQRKQFAEIVGNIAVAWFAAGIISPLFSKQSGIEAFLYVMLGMSMTGIFTFISLALISKSHT